jgi:ribosomal protein S18 acetylase RimI-like enzyme
MKKSLMVRPLRRDDRPRLERILRQTQVFLEMEVQCALELIDVYLNNADQKDYLLAGAVDESDQPRGYVCYGPTPLTAGTYDLYWIAVDPAWHGRGVGSLLMEYVERQVSDTTSSAEGARLMIIETSSLPRYESARRLYSRHHYREVARIPDFYADGDDRVIYAKRFHPKNLPNQKSV